MMDLSHWDFSEHFKAKEAAELIMGIPPEENTNVFGVKGDEIAYTQKITPVLRRMARAYQGAASTLYAASTWSEDVKEGLERYPANPIELHSEMMVVVREPGRHSGLSICKGEFADFEKAYFRRDEIRRWLDAIGMNSVYPFVPSKSDTRTTPSSKWPWGDHHTLMLGHLEAAARRFWGTDYYDPADKGTAPLNEDVSGWLQKERGVSKTLATAMASILRLDGLPTGPRK